MRSAPPAKEGAEMRRETFLLLATMAAMLAAATGVAIAATLNGTNGNDVLYGGSAADTIDGKGGADVIWGKGGNDTLYGGLGNDYQKTLVYDKTRKEYVGAGVRGGPGDDTIDGNEGDDDIEGNDGRDTVKDTSPNDTDRAWGGPGDDAINVADGDTRDQALCGEGPDGTSTDTDKDTAKIDVVYSDTTKTTITGADDVIPNCEQVTDQDGAKVDVSKLP